MSNRPILVIIPGIGDDLPVYRLFAKRWERFGYDVHIISFGWNNRRISYRQKMETFLDALDVLGKKNMYVIGVSAGGSAAINTFALRPHIRKIITLCAPLDTMPDLQNPPLAESIEQARQLLLHFRPDQKRHILSALALHDPVVHSSLSQPAGIRTLRIPMITHPASIFFALIFYARKLHGFLRRK